MCYVAFVVPAWPSLYCFSQYTGCSKASTLPVLKPCTNILTTLNILPETELIVQAFDFRFVLNCVHRFHGELMVLITKMQVLCVVE